jgi:hypothetical protein
MINLTQLHRNISKMVPHGEVLSPRLHNTLGMPSVIKISGISVSNAEPGNLEVAKVQFEVAYNARWKEKYVQFGSHPYYSERKTCVIIHANILLSENNITKKELKNVFDISMFENKVLDYTVAKTDDILGFYDRFEEAIKYNNSNKDLLKKKMKMKLIKGTLYGTEHS